MLPCVEVLNRLVPIHYSPDLDKRLLYHEIEDAEQIHDGEDGKEEEEGGWLDVTLSEDDKDENVADDTKCPDAREEDSLQDGFHHPGVNTVAGGVFARWHIFRIYVKALFALSYYLSREMETEGEWEGELFTFV